MSTSSSQGHRQQKAAKGNAANKVTARHAIRHWQITIRINNNKVKVNTANKLQLGTY